MEKRVFIKNLKEHVGESVTICGWVDVRRDHGKLIFIDLRDATGTVQMVALPTHEEAHTAANEVRPEWVLKVEGMVNPRPDKMVKEGLNGNLEIEITAITVLTKADTPPFDVSGDGREIDEELRLKYRYLDLRRPRLQKNIRNRHKVMQFMREFLTARDFVEIDTPILTKSSPEGARDYVVPSRIEQGHFYALPQSPQQYKQLLMVAGMERYFQFARCLRDEDTRGDRQPEFTQLDLEMSFITQEDILTVIEDLYTSMVKKLYPEKHLSASPWPRINYEDAMREYGNDRPDLRENKDDPNELAFAWVLNFPLFEPEMSDGHYAPSHHMFTMPREEDIAQLESDPASVKSYQHDLILNGYEIGGGSVRIHDPELQSKVFDLIGFGEEEKEYFNHMLTAFRYGVPPHGGIAPGIDRLMMILENEPNIRETIAFPKTGEGRDLMMGAPSTVSKKQLDELGISIDKKKS